MKWLEMTIFVVFLWYPFNVKVGNVKEFAVECSSPGQSRWMACSGCSKSSGKLWFEAWILPVTSSQLSDGVFLSPQQLVQSIKTNRSPNLVGTNFLNFLVCPRLIYNPKWDGMGGSKNNLRPGGKGIFLCGRTENWENWRVLNPLADSIFITYLGLGGWKPFCLFAFFGNLHLAKLGEDESLHLFFGFL